MSNLFLVFIFTAALLLSSCCPSPEGFVSCFNYFDKQGDIECSEGMVEMNGSCIEKQTRER